MIIIEDFSTVNLTQYAKALALQKKKKGSYGCTISDAKWISEVSQSSIFLFQNGVLQQTKEMY